MKKKPVVFSTRQTTTKAIVLKDKALFERQGNYFKDKANISQDIYFYFKNKMNMKRWLLAMALVVSVLSVWGQGCCADTVTFAGRIENTEYQVWIEMDFYHNDVVTPGQEIFGQVPGYFGAKRDTRKWIFVDAEVKGKQARLVITNDYGSEDLEARLTLERDGTYTLERLKGSTMKIVVGGKWVNIPKKLTFKRPVATKPAA